MNREKRGVIPADAVDRGSGSGTARRAAPQSA